MKTECSFLVIGSGIAGLSFASHAAQFGSVIVISKKEIIETNTNRAQGGIACVLEPDDSFESHIEDTLTAGAGLCNKEAVSLMVEKGPARIKDLLDIGINFSKDSKSQSHFHLGKEGGHSHNRIIHASDLTGQELERALLNHVRSLKNVTLYENISAVELITNHHIKSRKKKIRCFGAYVYDTKTEKVHTVRAKITCLVTGGAGWVYLHTTNPSIATGDGIAMAYRAGATIANMEFIQFHPTSLYHPQADSFLISEALRGAGAVLKDRNGREFMNEYHHLKSLAPRDIVARAIDNEMKKQGLECVYLDITNRSAAKIKSRFPNIYKRCKELGINITRDWIPVVPAAHYLCGGIQVDLQGNTDIENLYACGETACTGVHGANRLASNSLLEALVFSKLAAFDAGTKIHNIRNLPREGVPFWDDSGTIDNEEWILLAHNFKEIRSIMWDYVGIVRSNLRLSRAQRRMRLLSKEIETFYKRTRITSSLLELRNLVTTSQLIIEAAQKRHESRGLHFTTDYPQRNDSRWIKNTLIKHPES